MISREYLMYIIRHKATFKDDLDLYEHMYTECKKNINLPLKPPFFRIVQILELQSETLIRIKPKGLKKC